VERRMNVLIGPEGSLPMNMVMGALFPRCGDGALFNAL